MLVKFIGDLQHYEPIELVVDNIKQLLAGLRHVYGHDLANKLLNDKYSYVLYKTEKPEEAISIHPDLVTMDFNDYDNLLIVSEINGEVPAAAVAAVIGVSATSVTAIVVTAIINIALSIALSLIVNLISPTPEFDSDPAAAQKLDSALFNGAPNIREQGGSVPLIYGSPHCGGVLISSGLSTEEASV